MCMCSGMCAGVGMCAHVPGYQWKRPESIRVCGAGGTSSCEPLNKFWALNLDPLENQQGLLITEPSFQPHIVLVDYRFLKFQLLSHIVDFLLILISNRFTISLLISYICLQIAFKM